MAIEGEMREETVVSLVELLTLQQLDGKLIETLARLFSSKNSANWKTIHHYCDKIGVDALHKTNGKLRVIISALQPLHTVAHQLILNKEPSTVDEAAVIPLTVEQE
jgi:hypothetical protein